MNLDQFDAQQVCLNGHLVTNNASWSPENNEKFCSRCGERTITACQSCNEPLKGADRYSQTLDLFYRPPSKPGKHCTNCGKPYSWTQRSMDSAIALTNEVEGLDDSDRSRLKASLSDLAADTPKTEVALVWWKAFIEKAPVGIGTAMVKVLGDVATSEVKRRLGLP